MFTKAQLRVLTEHFTIPSTNGASPSGQLNIKNLIEVLATTEKEFMKVKNFGRASFLRLVEEVSSIDPDFEIGQLSYLKSEIFGVKDSYPKGICWSDRSFDDARENLENAYFEILEKAGLIKPDPTPVEALPQVALTLPIEMVSEKIRSSFNEEFLNAVLSSPELAEEIERAIIRAATRRLDPDQPKTPQTPSVPSPV